MTFLSILHESEAVPGESPLPVAMSDLQLEQIIEAVTAGYQEYGLKQVFHAPLVDEGTVVYRQWICQDLETGAVRETVETFSVAMREVRATLALAGSLHYRYQKMEVFLTAVEQYLAAVSWLASGLSQVEPRSSGFRAVRDYLGSYLSSESVLGLQTEARQLRRELASISYTVHIDGGHITVGRKGDEPDYTAEVEATFRRFRQGTPKDYRSALRSSLEMNHVEAMILDRVAALFTDTFTELASFCARHAGFQDPIIVRFDREVQFYLSYLHHIGELRRAGLAFTYPVVSAASKSISGNDVFDLALAGTLVAEGRNVVLNNFELSGPERILVVSGPNQGGKTTFARTIGQLHYLAALGLPVPASRARLYLPDRIFTHFEREENQADLRGKLHDELVRVHDILSTATPGSVIILNEIFTSTTLQDAVFLSGKILEKIIDLDLICVCVTFIDELSRLGRTTVSMVSTVDPADPAVRTFKILRQPADGSAYAKILARNQGLTYPELKEWITS
jgi:DNA mismatch repair protein MutS